MKRSLQYFNFDTHPILRVKNQVSGLAVSCLWRPTVTTTVRSGSGVVPLRRIAAVATLDRDYKTHGRAPTAALGKSADERHTCARS